MTTPTYRLEGVASVRGEREVLRGIDLDIAPGEVLALVGPNGAGKSTLLSVLAADLRPSAGAVHLHGRELGSWPTGELARTRSVLTQANQVSFAFTAVQVVTMGRSPWSTSDEAARDDEVVDAALAATDTVEFAERSFTTLSGGEQARVSLARVLAQETDVVLLDEPTAALDLRHQEDVMDLAGRLADAGRTVVVVVHDLSLAAAYADRVALLDRGELVAVGPPAEVLTPARIEQTYGIAVSVSEIDGRLVVLPRRGRRHVPHADTSSEQSDEVSYHRPDGKASR